MHKTYNELCCLLWKDDIFYFKSDKSYYESSNFDEIEKIIPCEENARTLVFVSNFTWVFYKAGGKNRFDRLEKRDTATLKSNPSIELISCKTRLGCNVSELYEERKDNDISDVYYAMNEQRQYNYSDDMRYYGPTLSSTVRKDIDKLKLDLFKLALNENTYEVVKTAPHYGMANVAEGFESRLLTNINGYDITSAHPYQMVSKKYPVGHAQWARTADTVSRVINNPDSLWFAKIDISQMKRTGAYNFFTIEEGQTELAIASPQYQILKENYSGYKLISLIYWTKEDFLPIKLRDYIMECFKAKTEAKTKVERKIAKLKINMIFGNFLRDPLKYNEIVNTHYPMIVGLFTLAYTWQQLYSYFKYKEFMPVYWDTDGIYGYGELPLEEINAGKQKGDIGYLKQEYKEAQAIFHSIKGYFIDGHYKFSGLRPEIAQAYFKGRPPMANDCIPKEYGLYKPNKKGELVPTSFTIGASNEVV